MGRPEIMRSGEVSLGDNPAGNEVDETQKQSTETIGPIPDANTEGHDHDADDPDKPLKKFAERYPADDRSATDESSDEQAE